MTALTQRVKVGAYYTNGLRLAEVTEVGALGYVDLRDTVSEETWSMGIDAFRRKYWLARDAAAFGEPTTETVAPSAPTRPSDPAGGETARFTTEEPR